MHRQLLNYIFYSLYVCIWKESVEFWCGTDWSLIANNTITTTNIHIYMYIRKPVIGTINNNHTMKNESIKYLYLSFPLFPFKFISFRSVRSLHTKWETRTLTTHMSWDNFYISLNIIFRQIYQIENETNQRWIFYLLTKKAISLKNSLLLLFFLSLIPERETGEIANIWKICRKKLEKHLPWTRSLPSTNTQIKVMKI